MNDFNDAKVRHKFYTSKAWRKVRQQVLKRANNECEWCRKQGRLTVDRLEVDHIKELEHHPEYALDINNLRVLCKDCHNKRHGRFNQVSSNKWKGDERW